MRSASRGKSENTRSMLRCRSARVALTYEPIRRFSTTVISGKMRRPSGTWTTPASTTWCDCIFSRSWPSNVIVPVVPDTMREMLRSVVDLPAPFEPTTVTISPFFTSRSMSQRTRRSP